MFDVNNKELKIGDKVVCSVASTGHLFVGRVSKFYTRNRGYRVDDLCTVSFNFFSGGNPLTNVSSIRIMKLEEENQNE